MILRSLVLRQFRNHSDLALDVDPGVNLFIGANGTGKTNIIEAIAVLTTGQSPRATETDSFVQWGKDGFSIKGTFQVNALESPPLTLEMKMRPGAPRTIRQNDEKAIRLRDLLGRVPLVSFFPEDLTLVKGEPDLRRQAINMILLQTDRAYAEALRVYTETLRMRNAALKAAAEGESPVDVLDSWDEGLTRAGLTVFRAREAFLKEFSALADNVHKRLTDGHETLYLEYDPSLDGPYDDAMKDAWRQKLRSMRPQEMALGSTLTGPHRDNFHFILNGRNARQFASEGQKRCCAVAFKLAAVPFFEKTLGERPLCLLDDVLSELDAERAQRLLDELAKTGQSFVTMTGLESWPKGRALPATVFRVAAHGVELDAAANQEVVGRPQALMGF